jgi:DHA1 family bicyclomycin/chloramphenicol resistance-like MFS transporter
MIAVSRIGRRLVGRVGAASLLRTGLTVNLIAATGLLVAALSGWGVLTVAAACFVLVASLGLITPNALALALNRHPDRAGGASGVFGLLQYLCGATVAPLVGVAGASVIPFGIAAAFLSVAAFLVRRSLAAPVRPVAVV